MFSFEQLLDFRELTASFRATQSITDYEMTKAFYTSPRDVLSDSVEMIFYPAINTPAPVNSRGTSARILNPQGGTKRLATIFHAFNKMPLPADALRALREPESFMAQEKGKQVVEMAMEEFVTRHALLTEAVISTIITHGRVNFDSNGGVLRPTINPDGSLSDASGTMISADFDVDDSHRKELNNGTDQIITNLWSNSDADIAQQLELLRYRCRASNIAQPTEIYLNPVQAKRHLRLNNEFRFWAQQHGNNPDKMLMGDVIENLWGFNWHFIGGTYQTAAGTTVDLIPQTMAVICPPPSQPWLRSFRGSELVPTSIDTAPDWQAALNSLNLVYGQFAYAKIEHDPVQIVMYIGDNWGISFADPNAIWMPTVFSDDATSGSGR